MDGSDDDPRRGKGVNKHPLSRPSLYVPRRMNRTGRAAAAAGAGATLHTVLTLAPWVQASWRYLR